jgi:hypothetical protein
MYIVANIPDILLNYRVHQSNITVINRNQMADSRKRVHYYQLERILGSKADENLVNILESISLGEYSKYKVATYEFFFHKLLVGNRLTSTYAAESFQEIITQLWFRILMVKSGRRILKDYFNSSIFSWSAFKFKHLRKMIKRTIRGH